MRMMVKGLVSLVQLRPVGLGQCLMASQSREPHLSLMEMMDGLLSQGAAALHQHEQPLLLTHSLAHILSLSLLHVRTLGAVSTDIPPC